MTEALGFGLLYYGGFAGLGAVAGILLAAAIQFFGR